MTIDEFRAELARAEAGRPGGGRPMPGREALATAIQSAWLRDGGVYDRRGWLLAADAALAAIGKPPAPAEDGVSLIAAERRRQVEREGWTPGHDDGHAGGELAISAAAYALLHTAYSGTGMALGDGGSCRPLKPEDPIRNLARAGALIAAEIDRLRRLEQTPASSPKEVADGGRP